MYIPRKASATVLAGVAIVAVLLAGAPLAAGTEAPAPMPTSSNVKDALINQNPDPNGPSIAPPNQDLWTKTMNQSMEEIINNFPNIVGQGVWDEKSGTSTQNYYTGADPAQEASFLAAARQIDALVPSSLKLVWKPVDWSDKERSSLVQQISADPEKWTSYFGSAPQGGNVGIDGNVHVSLTDPAKVSSSPAKSGLLPDGTPFIAEGPTENEWQVGRTTDVSPFTGGNLITAGSSYCTSGFNWTKWATSEKMGMTAAHCAVAAGLTWKTNSGGAWGTGVQSDPGRDALLVRASSGKSFNSPTVWVGNQTTSDLRAVKAAGAGLQLGNTVALSGAISGLGTGQVASFGNYRNGVGPMTFVSYTGCQGGDSGGPWLQTEYGTGLVIAWGQHEGKFLDYSNGRYYCGFMPLNDISAALQASLFTY